MERKAYPSDVGDDEWAFVLPSEDEDRAVRKVHNEFGLGLM